MTYDNKGSFGELALLYNMPRAATVQVSQISVVCSKMCVHLNDLPFFFAFSPWDWGKWNVRSLFLFYLFTV